MASKKSNFTKKEIKSLKINFSKGRTGYISNQNELQRLPMTKQNEIQNELVLCTKTNSDTEFVKCIENTLTKNKINTNEFIKKVKAFMN